jgi:hypothetical protein
MYDVEATVLSQFANSPAITALIADFQAWIDPTANLQNFYNLWWNILTAAGAGLDNWGKILGVGRYLTLPSTGTYVGFYNSEGDYVPMSQGPFFAGGSETMTYALSDAGFRTLLLAKALANITSCSIQALNALAQAVFGAGACYVTDGGNMTMTYTFTSAPTPVQLAIATNSGVLPHPTGVAVSIIT